LSRQGGSENPNGATYEKGLQLVLAEAVPAVRATEAAEIMAAIRTVARRRTGIDRFMHIPRGCVVTVRRHPGAARPPRTSSGAVVALIYLAREACRLRKGDLAVR